MAVKAGFALKAGERFGRVRLAMVCPGHGIIAAARQKFRLALSSDFRDRPVYHSSR